MMLLPNERLWKMFGEAGAIRRGHFVYTQPEGHGDHGDMYIDKAAIFPHVTILDRLCDDMAHMAHDLKIETVVGPALGGIILANRVASHLTQVGGRPVFSVFAEKGTDGWIFRGNFRTFVADHRVLVVEDIINSGGSVSGVIKLVRESGGFVAGVSALANRGTVTARQLEIPSLTGLLNVNLTKTPEENCGQCRRWEPIITDVGHGKTFITRMRAESRWSKCRRCGSEGVLSSTAVCGACQSDNIVPA